LAAGFSLLAAGQKQNSVEPLPGARNQQPEARFLKTILNAEPLNL
jgi:hypothetical protein